MRSCPSSNCNSSPWPFLLLAIYEKTAATGHSSLKVFPMKIFSPCWNGSFSDALMVTLIMRGFDTLFPVTSEKFRWVPLSYIGCLRQEGDFIWTKEAEIAQTTCRPNYEIMMNWNFWGSFPQTLCNFNKMSGVMDSLGLAICPCLAAILFVPLVTCSSVNIAWNLGSGKWSEKVCRWRMDDKYKA